MREDDLKLLNRRLLEIRTKGWIANQRPGNVGGVGNTLEDLLDVAENNYQLPDFGAWELKSQRADTSSLLTLFHSEPLPRKAKIVPCILLPKYGWSHQEAGTTYPTTERSFRQTINAISYSDRGFKVNVDSEQKIIYIDFNYSLIEDRHSDWRHSVEVLAGTGDINPHPYWTFADIDKKLNTKLNNLMYVVADRKVVGDTEYFKYNHIEVYVDPTIDRFIDLVNSGDVYVDFDARTGHNHGTKFRIKTNKKVNLYKYKLNV